MAKKEKKFVIPGEYFYSPHHKYEGVLELYWVDKNGIEHCVQNFCLEENALALAKEDKFWRINCYPITHFTRVHYDTAQKKEMKSYRELNLEEEGAVEARRLARKKRRQERKAKLEGKEV